MGLFTQLIGDGRPDVVFLHGLFGRGKNWAGIARALADDGHTSVLFDLPDHGRSPWTDRFDYAAMADEVASELRLRLGSAARVCVIGHSMGGKVAMLLALQHPELVRSLVVVDIAPDFSAGVEANVPLVAAMRALDLTALERRSDADRILAADVPDAAVRQFLLQNLKLTRAPGQRNEWRWELNLDLLGAELDAVAGWPDVGEVSFPGPVLWVGGENSPYLREEHRAAMLRLFPATKQVWIPGAGHWVHADSPRELTAELTAFLDG